MATVDIDGDKLYVDGTVVSFPGPIAEHIVFENCVVVRLKLTGDHFDGIHQNVLAIEYDGTTRWNIEKAPAEGYYDAYSGIHVEDGQLYAYNLSGMSYQVDIDTGSLDEGTFVK